MRWGRKSWVYVFCELIAVWVDPYDNYGDEADRDEDAVEDKQETIDDVADVDPVLCLLVRLRVLRDLLLQVLDLSPHFPQLLHGLTCWAFSRGRVHFISLCTRFSLHCENTVCENKSMES